MVYEIYTGRLLRPAHELGGDMFDSVSHRVDMVKVP